MVDPECQNLDIKLSPEDLSSLFLYVSLLNQQQIRLAPLSGPKVISDSKLEEGIVRPQPSSILHSFSLSWFTNKYLPSKDV